MVHIGSGCQECHEPVGFLHAGYCTHRGEVKGGESMTAKKLIAQLSPEGRMAVIIARTVLNHDGGVYDAGTTADRFGATDFEARLIGLAYYWSNDLMDLALTELCIEIPERLQASTHDVVEPRKEWLSKELDRFPDYAL